MIAHRALPYHCLVALGLAGLLWAAPAAGEDIPAFQYAFGTPVIEPVWREGSSTPCRRPSMALDSSHVYIGGEQINVFTREGEWVGFWPIASDIRLPDGVGDTGQGAPIASDIALAPPDRLFVFEGVYGVVQVYTREGEFLGGWDCRADGVGAPSWPKAIAVDQSSVYALAADPGRVVRFDLEGNFLNAWDIPALPEPYFNRPVGIAADPAGGVWVLHEARYFSEAEWEWVRDARCYKYAPNGSEEVSWPLSDGPECFGIDTDAEGNVWVMADGPDTACQLRRFTPSGDLLAEVDAPSGVRGNFAVAPDATLGMLSPSCLDYWDWLRRGIFFSIVYKGFDGAYLGSVGGTFDMVERGLLLAPGHLAVDSQGNTYTKLPLGWRGLSDYICRYAPDGELLEVVETENWPLYNPASDAVEFVEAPWQPNFVDLTGTYLMYSAEWLDWPPDDLGVLDLVVQSPTTHEILSIVLPSALAPEPGGNCCCRDAAVRQAHDGNLLLAVWEVVDDYETGATMFVLTVTRDGTVLTSATIEQPAWEWYPQCVEQDDAENIYIGNWHGVWKFSASGEFIGRIGGWGGEGDQRDAPGSLVLDAQAIDIDATGRLRVLDYEANRILLFAYTPGPFPDVSYSHWAKEAVAAAVEAGIVCGYADGLYRPDRSITRDQTAVCIARSMAGGDECVPDFTGTPTFRDVTRWHWASDYVEYAFDENVIAGYDDGLYHPEYEVTRDQMAVYVARGSGWVTNGDDMAGASGLFPDVPAGHWAGAAIQECLDRGVVAGYLDGLYHPEIVVTRDQMAVYVARAFGLVP